MTRRSQTPERDTPEGDAPEHAQRAVRDRSREPPPEEESFDDLLLQIEAEVGEVIAERARTRSEDPLADLRKRALTDTAPLGHYELVGVLGRGGMGTVFLARDPRLDRKVAVKLWNSDEPEAQAALIREATALAKLSHPNVITVYECDEHEDRVFFVMEYIDGFDGDRWAGRDPLFALRFPDHPLSWREALRVYIAAGRGLAAAHDAGIVHRDFKPANVMIGLNGDVKVGDFGVAEIAEIGEHGSGVDGSDSVKTRPGTPATMAPECLSGRRGDARSDQYSFVASLWWTLFNAFPYPGRTYEELAAAIAVGKPLQVGPKPLPGVPRQVRRALEKGLACEPEARHDNMHVLLRVLQDAPEQAVAQRRSALYAGFLAFVGTMMLGMFGVVVVKPAVQAMRAPVESQPEVPAIEPAADLIGEALALIDVGEFKQAEDRWRAWYGSRYAVALPVYGESLRVGRTFLAQAQTLKDIAPKRAYEAASRAETVCNAAQLDFPTPNAAPHDSEETGATDTGQEFSADDARICADTALSLKRALLANQGNP